MKTNIERAKEVRDNLTNTHRDLYHLICDIDIAEGKIPMELGEAMQKVYNALQTVRSYIQEKEELAKKGGES